jgi:hypothetical protein
MKPDGCTHETVMPVGTAKAIIWPDGCMDRAPSWAELFDRVRLDQWHDYSRKEFRREMAERALVVAGVELDLDTCRFETLFRLLEAVDMCRIVEGLPEDA